MRAGAGTIGRSEIEVPELYQFEIGGSPLAAGNALACLGSGGHNSFETVLSLKKTRNARFYRVGVEQDGDAETFLERRQFGGKLAMVRMPVSIETTAYFDGIRFTAIAVQWGKIEGAGRTEFGVFVAAIKHMSLGIAVEVDHVTRLCRCQEPDTQRRCEVIESVQMPIRIGYLMRRIGHRIRDVERNIGADMRQADQNRRFAGLKAKSLHLFPTPQQAASAMRPRSSIHGRILPTELSVITNELSHKMVR